MAVYFVDGVHGWSVGHEGCILRTSTGNNLDVALLTGEENLIAMIIGLVAVAVVVPLGVFSVLRKRKRSSDSSRGLEPE
jgi:hypothetical protein